MPKPLVVQLVDFGDVMLPYHNAVQLNTRTTDGDEVEPESRTTIDERLTCDVRKRGRPTAVKQYGWWRMQ